jgi:hypothetical protein
MKNIQFLTGESEVLPSLYHHHHHHHHHHGSPRSHITRGMNSRPVVRFQVLTAASMMFRIVFWDILPCKMIVDRRFRAVYCLHHHHDWPPRPWTPI